MDIPAVPYFLFDIFTVTLQFSCFLNAIIKLFKEIIDLVCTTTKLYSKTAMIWKISNFRIKTGF